MADCGECDDPRLCGELPPAEWSSRRPITFVLHTNRDGIDLQHYMEVTAADVRVRHPKISTSEERAVALAFMHGHLDDPEVWHEVEPGRWQMPVELYDDGGEQMRRSLEVGLSEPTYG